jgi:hypothetical protein
VNPTDDLDAFGRLVAALEPWLGEIVIVGGWAHRLYRMHPHAQTLDYAPVMTLDTDVAVDSALPVPSGAIRDRMLEQGFTEDFLGDDRPPATHYYLGNQEGGFYAEFLSPLTGAGHDRRGRRKATANIGGITSQQLRHVELLLDSPWSVEFHRGDIHAAVQIANPVAFLAQKALIHGKRDRSDRAKDILYMHDTLEIFGAQLDELRLLWEAVAARLHPRNVTTVVRASHQLFGELSDDTRRAAEIPIGRDLSPEDIQAACRHGFGAVFGRA